MITKLKNLFKKKEKKSKITDLMNSAPPVMIVKQGRPTSTSKAMEFIAEYEKQKPLLGIKDVPFVEDNVLSKFNTNDKPMKMNDFNKSRLRDGIVVSLEFKVKRHDLEFINVSRIDGKPVYLYTGNDFASFNLPYEEVVSSPNIYSNPTKSKSSYFDDKLMDMQKSEKRQRTEMEKMSKLFEDENRGFSNTINF